MRPGGNATSIPDQAAYAEYSAAHGFAIEGQTSAGPSVGILYDTRDNSINADHGVLANAVYRTYFNGLLGGDSTWQSLNIDVRTYRPLTHDARQKLAFWFLGNLVTGGTAPYFDLPAISFDGRSARGYSEARYRGEHLLYGEVEYRGALSSNGLLGFVAFLNTTFVDDTTTGQKLFDSTCARRRIWFPPAPEQTIAHELLHRLGLGQGRIARPLPRDSGSLLGSG